MLSVYRAFESLREIVSTRDDAAIVAEIERGEDYLKNKFQAALEHTDLTPDGRRCGQFSYGTRTVSFATSLVRG